MSSRGSPRGRPAETAGAQPSVARPVVHVKIMMDEPFAALDVPTRFQMQSFLRDIWRGSGKTVVFVTHHIDEAVYLADRVVVPHGTPRQSAGQRGDRHAEAAQRDRR